MSRQPTVNDARGHWVMGGDFTPGSPFLNAVPIEELVAMAGADRTRIRFQTTGAGGTLQARFVRPDGSDAAYNQGQPVDLTIADGVGAVLDINPHYGEGLLKLTFVPSGNGSVVYCDISQS
jgi:hypothetical protein